MSEILVSTILVIVLFVGIWWNYKLFMRGNSPEEKAKARLPVDFKPDLFYARSDTYVGYEKGTNRLAIVDAQHAKVIQPKDVVSVEPEEDSIAGVRHQWLVVNVRDQAFPRYRIWFRFNRQERDGWLQRLKEICS